MNIKKELSGFMFYQLENGQFHKDYNEELAFYELVKQGDIEKIQEYEILHIPDDLEGYGRLSDDPMRNLTYHFVILAAMLTRACIEGNMNYEAAYSLSDIYIRAADRCKNIQQIQFLHREMILDYTMRMKDIYKDKIYSKPVSMCISYIEKSINKRIRVAEIANKIGIDRSYLSRLFRKEIGMSISDYIAKMKIDASINMILYSELTYSEIAENLGFASQSHFIDVFKKNTGTTPKKFCMLKI